jgi:hypothetical protein
LGRDATFWRIDVGDPYFLAVAMDCVTIGGFERQIVWPTNATVFAEILFEIRAEA